MLEKLREWKRKKNKEEDTGKGQTVGGGGEKTLQEADKQAPVTDPPCKEDAKI